MVDFMLCNKGDVNLIPFYEANGYLASVKKDGTRAIATIQNNKVILKVYPFALKLKQDWRRL